MATPVRATPPHEDARPVDPSILQDKEILEKELELGEGLLVKASNKITEHLLSQIQKMGKIP